MDVSNQTLSTRFVAVVGEDASSVLRLMLRCGWSFLLWGRLPYRVPVHAPAERGPSRAGRRMQLGGYSDQPSIQALLQRHGTFENLKANFRPLSHGSRVTPRLISACARSRLWVRRVFVRMTTGRWVSFASKKANASFGGKNLKSFSARYCEYP